MCSANRRRPSSIRRWLGNIFVFTRNLAANEWQPLGPSSFCRRNNSLSRFSPPPDDYCGYSPFHDPVSASDFADARTNANYFDYIIMFDNFIQCKLKNCLFFPLWLITLVEIWITNNLFEKQSLLRGLLFRKRSYSSKFVNGHTWPTDATIQARFRSNWPLETSPLYFRRSTQIPYDFSIIIPLRTNPSDSPDSDPHLSELMELLSHRVAA